LILEYHRVLPKDTRYDRSIKKFRQDLQLLYEKGFRPITLSQYLDNKIDIAPGASPVVITFDDSDPSQFTILPDGTIDPNCAVGIWQKFAQKYPDFPIRAMFYILPNGPFGQKALQAKKMQMLKEWGCEVGSHTWNHKNLTKLSDNDVKFQITRSVDWIRSLGFEPRHLALPYGNSPKNPSILKGFMSGGKRYGFDSVTLAGSAPAYAPTDKRLNPYRIPRVQAVDIDYGFKYWLEVERKMRIALYVKP
jgi:peptidoglycan/xylan/chitin deacetylase (PgdA/CDA1 family)